jgi:hypothetical protein
MGLEWNRSSGSKGEGIHIAVFRGFSPTLYCWQGQCMRSGNLFWFGMLVLMALLQDHTDGPGNLYLQ